MDIMKQDNVIEIIGKKIQCTQNIKGGWQNYSNPKQVNMIVKDGDFLWCAAEGGVVKWDLKNNSYFHYTVLDGLVDNNVCSIVIDFEKNIWVGTIGSGLSKFDGKQWTPYLFKNAQLGKYIQAMTIDHSNNIWLTTERGISSFDGKCWTHYQNVHKWLKKNSVWSICVDDDNVKWFGTTNEGVIKYDGKQWEMMPRINSLSSVAINTICVDRNNHIWIGTINGISKYDGKKWHYINDKVNGYTEAVSTIVEDKEGNVWIGTNGGRVLDVNGNIWLGSIGNGVIKYDVKNHIERFSHIDGLLHNNIRAIYVDENNDKWFGTDEGLNKFNGSQWASYIVDPNGLPSNKALSIAVDENNNKWIGTARRGLCKFDGKTWASYTDESGSPKNNVQSIAIDNNDEIWCGTGAGALKFNGKEWQMHTTVNGLAHDYISPVAIDSGGNKWFGTRGGGVSKFDGVNWSTFNHATTHGGIGNNVIRAIAIDKQENIWVGTDGGGVSEYDGREWKLYTTEQGLSCNNVFAIAVDKYDNKWFGTLNGISKYNGKKWTHIGPSFRSMFSTLKMFILNLNHRALINYIFKSKWICSYDLAGRYIRAIEIDKEGNIWFAALGGVSKYNGKNWIKYTTTDGLANQNVRSIAVDNEGCLWFGTIAGVSKFCQK
ncbi:MAG: hypothetical protein JW920_06560 [Deltaproteobacteria bacterium]|nr:hypothetical protein [Deltaproteobacteria bacterium]